MPTEFYFEIQYFNFDWNQSTITLLQSHRNTQQWQVHGVTATVGKTPPYRPVLNLKICRRKVLFCVHLNNVVLNFFLNFKRPATEFLIYGVKWRHAVYGDDISPFLIVGMKCRNEPIYRISYSFNQRWQPRTSFNHYVVFMGVRT